MIRLLIENGKLFFNGNQIVDRENLFWSNKRLVISKIDDLYLLKFMKYRCSRWVSLIHKPGEYWLEKHNDYLPIIQQTQQNILLRHFANILTDYGISSSCVNTYGENENIPVWKNALLGIDFFHDGTLRHCR